MHDSVKLGQPERFLWKPELHTCESKTNAYGEVIFQGTGKKTRAKVYLNIQKKTFLNKINPQLSEINCNLSYLRN